MATSRGSKKAADNSWPLGEYLRKARGKMAIREAARRADISESRWRQVEAGVQRLAGGIEVPVHPKAETVAAMCKAVSADVARGLELAGHDPNHYTWLVQADADAMPADVRLEWFSRLPREEREAVLAELQRMNVDIELERRQHKAG